MKIEIPQQTMVKLADLKPYPKNTKKHTQTQINNVAESIRQFGFVQPFVIDKNNEVVIGHCRLLAAQKLGIEEIPCVYVDYLTKAQIKALRILDNKLNESEWDMDFLNEELPELDLTAFEIEGWDEPETNAEEDYEEEKRIWEARMARGEIGEDTEEYQEFLAKFEPKKNYGRLLYP